MLRLPILSFVLVAILAPLTVTSAPVELQDSSSPNGRYVLTIEPNSDQEGTGTLQIRNVKDQKILASFEWAQFGPVISSTSAKAVWNADESAFALITYQSRGWTGTDLYVEKDSKWVHTGFPKFKGLIVGHNGWECEGKGRLVVVAWLPENTLKADFVARPYWTGQGNPPPIGDIDEDDWAFFKLNRLESGPILKFLRVVAKTPEEIKIRNDELEQQ